MWQRRGNRPPAISQPMQFTELDRDDWHHEEHYLETIMEVESICSRRQSLSTVLPELPFRDVPPMTEIPQPVNLHSQQSPTRPTSREHGLRINVRVKEQESRPDEVSPLTPTGSGGYRSLRDERPVSPIEPLTRAIARVPLPDRSLQSQISRKALRSAGSEQAQTKWDEYSGEPTTDNKGKPASVRPGSQPLEMQYPHLKERTKQILAGLRERDAAQNLQWGRTPPPVAESPSPQLPQRQSWKGSSGRVSTVEPVRNVPSARQGSVQLPESARQRTNIIDAFYECPTPTSSSPHLLPLRSAPSEEEIRPIPPLKPGRKIKTPELVTKMTRPISQIRSPSASPEPLLTPHEPSPVISYHRAESPHNDEEPKTPDTPVTVEIPGMVGKPDTLLAYEARDMNREQSRFSWTTYTTSAAESSPRSMAQVVRDSSPPPPIPDFPPSITIKKRPVSMSPFAYSSPYDNRSFTESTTSVVRKPLPTVNPRSSSMSSATSRAMSTSKSLPPTPTVLEASDKIESCDAQLEALNRRKHNINKIIAGLEASLKRNAIVYDMWKRKEVEKNITNHRLELDDISREIHDLSLQRNRIQRKRDRDDGYEACTGLWIKRVTS